jgi:probable F420-dependent oxidoreductase
MKFGPGLPTGMEGLINPIPFFRPSDFVFAGQLAERLGYDSIWGNDHYAAAQYVRDTYDEPPNFYEVLTVLTAVAATTSRIEVGTAVLVLPMRDAVMVAKQAATIDQLSGGRLLLGVGIGAYREEYEAARPDRFGKDRGKILEEGLELLQRLDGDEPVTFEGEYFRTKDLDVHPKAHRRPFPVLVGGHQQRAIDRAVQYGQGWIPGWRPFDELREWISIFREKAAAAGRDPASMIAAPQFSCLIGRTQEEAKRTYENSGMVQHRISLSKTGRDPALAMDNNLVGSPEVVLEKLATLHEAGADHLPCMTFCVNTVSEYFEQLHMFAELVMRPYRKEFGIPEPGAAAPVAVAP